MLVKKGLWCHGGMLVNREEATIVLVVEGVSCFLLARRFHDGPTCFCNTSPKIKK